MSRDVHQLTYMSVIVIIVSSMQNDFDIQFKMIIRNKMITVES